jgi:hypothetical protein
MAFGESMTRHLKVVLWLVLVHLGGCATEPVKPWQKEHLARQDMNHESDTSTTRYLEHIYFSREGTSGGMGIGGGGCGCN